MARRATTGGSAGQAGPRLLLASASPRRLELLSRVGLVPEVAPAEVDETVRPGEAPRDAARRLAAAKADRAAGRLGAEAAFVVAADTIVAVDALPLGKPADPADAARMLASLSGRTHEVHTGFVVIGVRGGSSGPSPDNPSGSALRSAKPTFAPGAVEPHTGSRRPPADTLPGSALESAKPTLAAEGPTETPARVDRVEGVVTTRVRVKRLTAPEIEGYVATGEPFGKAGGYAIQGIGAFMVEGVEGSVTNVIGLPLVEVLEALASVGGPGPFGVR